MGREKKANLGLMTSVRSWGRWELRMLPACLVLGQAESEHDSGLGALEQSR